MATLDYASTSPRNFWTPRWRLVVFMLAATSIWCLLAEFYGLVSMRAFTLYVFLPAMAVLTALCIVDWRAGDGRMWRNVLIGTAAGFLGAVAYDVFRLPFVYADAWRIDSVVPKLPLFKVFPLFGQMILQGAGSEYLTGPVGITRAGRVIYGGEPGFADHLVGWAYHFSNGMTFGVMFMAVLGAVRGAGVSPASNKGGTPSPRAWWWAIVFAVGLECLMLVSPYTKFFGIKPGTTFVVVTMTAHVVFGIGMGLSARRLSSMWHGQVS